MMRIYAHPVSGLSRNGDDDFVKRSYSVRDLDYAEGILDTLEEYVTMDVTEEVFKDLDMIYGIL